MFDKKAQIQELTIARTMRDTLCLQSQIASNRVLEGEAILQSLRDEAQVAHIRVEEINEDIAHMQEYFREIGDPESSDQAPPSIDEVDIPLSVESISDDVTSVTSRSQGGERIFIEATRDVEVTLATTSTATPLTESALKQSDKEIT